ncbi:DNA primase [Schlesneria sp. T3-172]|uniref:DNA primase n=1 Tax=Schlesneria sphaerica TaxID=3373610 RepID=UPI0037C5DC47
MTMVPGPSADEFKETVRSRTDIVHLIGETVTLQPNGRVFKGLCPFHDDHNPSFTVNPERQTYKCWSCQEGGDCFSFVMKHDALNFRETLEMLAARAGLEIPKTLRRGPDEKKNKPHLYDVLAWAEQEFHQCLLSTAVAERARNYLLSRGFNHAMTSRFKLGYHPESWDWLLQRAKGQFDPELLVEADLARPRDGQSGFYDKFVDRIMFPIHDERGRTVAFGGRILPDSKSKSDAKYLNSSETPVFSKSRICYALDVARDAIKKTDMVLVMEGYADCVKAHQGGILNAVATLGTALTESHVTLLKRLARKVVLVFDGDRAGIEAAEKAIPRFLAQDVDLRILTVPDELDPDEFIDQRGGDALLALAEDAPEAFEYQLRLLLGRYGTTTLDGRQRVLDGMLNLLLGCPGIHGTVREDMILGKLPQRVGLSEVEVRRRLKELQNKQSVQPSRVAERKVNVTAPADDVELRQWKQAIDSLQRSANGDDLLECELLQMLFAHPHLTDQVRREIGANDLRHELLQEILSHWFDMLEEGVEPTYDRLLSRTECPQRKRLMVWIDEQARHREYTQSLADARTMGTETAEDGVRRVIDRIRWRRSVLANQASKSLLFERPAETAKLTTETRRLLEQAARFHRERTTK